MLYRTLCFFAIILVCIAILSETKSHAVSAMPGVPAPAEIPPKHESTEKKPLTCDTYHQRVWKDIQEINKSMEGGFIHRTDLWVLALSLRIIAHAEGYHDASCKPFNYFPAKACESTKHAFASHLQTSEDKSKKEVTRTAYSTRARANAAALACFCPGTLTPIQNTCDDWKEKSGIILTDSGYTEDRNTILLFSTQTTTYGFLYRTFCKPR
ncbi:MAG: hypothetical protein Q8O83_01575 [bacterium]|nr:hypothetical protein [bacterium]